MAHQSPHHAAWAARACRDLGRSRSAWGPRYALCQRVARVPVLEKQNPAGWARGVGPRQWSARFWSMSGAGCSAARKIKSPNRLADAAIHGHCAIEGGFLHRLRGFGFADAGHFVAGAEAAQQRTLVARTARDLRLALDAPA